MTDKSHSSKSSSSSSPTKADTEELTSAAASAAIRLKQIYEDANPGSTGNAGLAYPESKALAKVLKKFGVEVDLKTKSFT